MADVGFALALFGASLAIAVLLLALPINDTTLSPVSWIRAKELFLSKMTEAEKRHWNRDRRLTIVGSTGRRYTLSPYESYNIRAGKYAYCLRVVGRIPPYDKLLAQRLLVESDEPTFLTVANKREI